MKFILSILKSFGYAFSGITHCLKTQRNFRIHTVAAVTVIGFGILYGLTPTEWAIIMLTIGGVLACEMINTAIESAVDRTGTHIDGYGKTAKDSAAGATLILAIISVVIAVFIFSDLDRLLPALTALFTTWKVGLFIAYVIVSVIFIKGKNQKNR